MAHVTNNSRVVLLLALTTLLLSCGPGLSFSNSAASNALTRALLPKVDGVCSLTRLFLSGRTNEEDDVGVGPSSVNVLGTTMKCCCADVGASGIGTGFYRNGYCSTGEQDLGRHTVCVQVTKDFLKFSAAVGNDLSTPIPQYMFPGLKDGDIWCLCAQRWAQAYQAGKAPKLFLQATHEKTLDFVPFDILREYALDKEEADQSLDNLNAQREKLKRLLE